jgi:hypothetical protein
MSRIDNEHGFAMIMAIMGLLLIGAVGSALVLSTSVETLIARSFREGAGTLYAADAVAAYARLQLASDPDWTRVLNGAMRSSWADGAPRGPRSLRDGSTINLTEILNLANCGTPAACSLQQTAAINPARPWGANNPRWQLYAWGRLADWVAGEAIDVWHYGVALVADDPAETDGDPLVDGPGPGFGVLLIRAEAFGPGRTHAVVEQTVARVSTAEPGRADPREVRVVSWRVVR